MRRRRLNSGYSGNSDQRRTQTGTITPMKHYIERNLGNFSNSNRWTPARINTALWLDASDISTITVATGVSVWLDKSGNNRNASQSVAPNQPLYIIGGLNNLNVLRFDGINDFFHLLYNASPAPHTVFAIINRRAGGTADNQVIISAIQPNAPFGVNMSAKAPRIPQWGSYISSWVSGGATLSTGSAAIIGIVSPTSTSGTELYRTNGAQSATVAYTSRYVGDENNRRAIGADLVFSSGYLSADIAEIIIFMNSLTTSECQLIEGYLAWKWGLQANLPTNHPYKNVVPTI